MANQKVYYVAMSAGTVGGWDVRDDAGGVVSHHETQDDAIAAANRLAAGDGGQVDIHER